MSCLLRTLFTRGTVPCLMSNRAVYEALAFKNPIHTAYSRSLYWSAGSSALRKVDAIQTEGSRWKTLMNCNCRFVCLCNNNVNSRQLHCSVPLRNQTEVEMAEFLREEISNEEQSSSHLAKSDKLHDFVLEKSDRCSLVFSRNVANEKVNVVFNVNHSVEEERDPEQMSDPRDDVEPPQLRSKPAFTVIIAKANKKVIHINCEFPSQFEEDSRDVPADEYDDLIEIVNVVISDSMDQVGENDYSLQGHIMDPNLYDMILGMLEERGINADFVNELVKFSTAYEHKMYVDFLKSLHSLVSSN